MEGFQIGLPCLLGGLWLDWRLPWDIGGVGCGLWWEGESYRKDMGRGKEWRKQV